MKKYSSIILQENQNLTSSDLFRKCKVFQEHFTEWSAKSSYLYRTPRTAHPNNKFTNFSGYKNMLMMGSNDYLGLAGHPRVVKAAHRALAEFGFGSTGSPLTTGTTVLHEMLAQRLAAKFNKESAVLFNSGYAANIGAITALVRQDDLCAIDQLAHASLHDAVKMSGSTKYTFRHNNVLHLDRTLSKSRRNHNGSLLITESIFSMDGDVAPLKELVETAKHYETKTYVDEAHSFGVIGKTGLGGVELFGVIDDVDLIMGTFSKICGGIGGFVVGTKEVCDWLYWYARSQMFSVSLPPSTVAATLTALEILDEQPERIERLHRNIRFFSKEVQDLGFQLPPNHFGPIVPVVIGDEEIMERMTDRLLEHRIFVTPIIYPAVSRDRCRFRFTVTSEMTIEDLKMASDALADAMRATNFNPIRTKRK